MAEPANGLFGPGIFGSGIDLSALDDDTAFRLGQFMGEQLRALTAERDNALAEVARRRQEADRSWRLLADARTACKRLTAGLIANASLLDVPFTNAPDLSPWSRSVKPAIDALRAALGMRGAAALPCCEFHNRNCEPPSELCCERCSEDAHPNHAADGSVCIAPDLSTAYVATDEAAHAALSARLERAEADLREARQLLISPTTSGLTVTKLVGEITYGYSEGDDGR